MWGMAGETPKVWKQEIRREHNSNPLLFTSSRNWLIEHTCGWLLRPPLGVLFYGGFTVDGAICNLYMYMYCDSIRTRTRTCDVSHLHAAFLLINMTHTNLWLSMYLVRSTLVLGSCTYALDTSGTVITSTSLRPVSEENKNCYLQLIVGVSIHGENKKC